MTLSPQETSSTIGVSPPCRTDPDLWFPDDFEGEYPGPEEGSPTREQQEAMNEYLRQRREKELRAQFVCLEECPFVAECLALGMDEEHGVWGAHTPSERERLRNGDELDNRHVKYRKSRIRDYVIDLFKAGMSIDDLALLQGTTRANILYHLADEIACTRPQILRRGGIIGARSAA